MSWLGDNFDFEAFNAKKLLKNVWEKPDQTLLGAQEPVGAGIWNGILGEDKYNANLNLLGGPSGTTWLDPGTKPGTDTYSQAEAAGINTKPAEQTHDLAETIAIAYLLNAGGSALGGAGGGAAGGAEAGAAGGSSSGAGLLGDIGTTNMGATTGMEWGGSFGGSGGGMGSGLNWGGSFGGGGGGMGGAASSGFNWQDLMKNMQGQQQGPAKQNPYAGTQQPIYDNDAEQMRVRQLAAQLRRADAEGY